MRAHRLAVIGLLVCGDPTAACPLDRLTRIASEPLKGLQRTEQALSEVIGGEGGRWQIYRRRNGTLHSIVRFDLGETMRSELRASFATPNEFVIVATAVRYKFPLPNPTPGVASTESTRYFFCRDLVYIPASLGDDASAAQALADAKELRSSFFDASEIAPYLSGRK